MRKLIVIAALESEFFNPVGSIEKIFYTGIGKVNATRMVTQIILEERPRLILNVGTAGCLNKESLGKVFGIKDVIERDMMAEPLAPRGTVPFSGQSPILVSSFGTARCATGDSFVTTKDSWLDSNSVDLVDMELFAIAKVANHYNIEWKSIKFASDLANEGAALQWTYSLKEANFKINEMIDQALIF